MVKADGYGLGARQVTKALFDAGCRRFFVATIDEAIALRSTIPADNDVYVLEGLIYADSVAEFDTYSLVPVLNSLDDIDTWARHASRADGCRAILALDTGMNRLGLTPSEASDLADAPERLAGFDIDYVMSHLACADEPESPKNAEQRQLFDDLRARLPPVKASFANSGGIKGFASKSGPAAEEETDEEAAEKRMAPTRRWRARGRGLSPALQAGRGSRRFG